MQGLPQQQRGRLILLVQSSQHPTRNRRQGHIAEAKMDCHIIGENDFAKYLNFNIPCDFCKGDSKGHNYFMVEQDSSWANYSTEKL